MFLEFFNTVCHAYLSQPWFVPHTLASTVGLHQASFFSRAIFFCSQTFLDDVPDTRPLLPGREPPIEQHGIGDLDRHAYESETYKDKANYATAFIGLRPTF